LRFTIYDKSVLGARAEGQAILASSELYPNGFDGDLPISGESAALLRIRVRLCTQDPGTQVFEFEPGDHGVDGDTETGLIYSVSGQAKRLGVKTGWRILRLNDMKFSNQLLSQLMNGSEEYTVRFATREELSSSERPALARAWVPLCPPLPTDDYASVVPKLPASTSAEDEDGPNSYNDNVFRNGTLWLFRRAVANADTDIAELLAGAPRALPLKRRGGC
jgi:hypothetical protein